MASFNFIVQQELPGSNVGAVLPSYRETRGQEDPSLAAKAINSFSNQSSGSSATVPAGQVLF